jgi:hypothetical protein
MRHACRAGGGPHPGGDRGENCLTADVNRTTVGRRHPSRPGPLRCHGESSRWRICWWGGGGARTSSYRILVGSGRGNLDSPACRN